MKPTRRIAAVVMPSLLEELARDPRPNGFRGPLAVVLTDGVCSSLEAPVSCPGSNNRLGLTSGARGVPPIGRTGHVGAEGAARNKVGSRQECPVTWPTRAATGGPDRVGQDCDLPGATLGSTSNARTRLDAVNAAARKFGIHPRQTIAEAMLRAERLQIRALPRQRVTRALQQIAEVALGFGSPVSFQAPDTVWVDVTGSSHLFEDERELGAALVTAVRHLGYEARAAISTGPWLARAFALHGNRSSGGGVELIDAEHTARESGKLPIIALPLPEETIAWFARLGLLSLDELRKLPAAELVARLEDGARAPLPGAPSLLELIRGRDESGLVPYQPEGTLLEEMFWDDASESIEPLLFALKSLSHRLSARLEGRAQAVRELLALIHYDRSIAALKQLPSVTHCITFKLAAPLARAEELERVVRARLSRKSLDAPAVGFSLIASEVTGARTSQLELNAAAHATSGLASSAHELALLAAELVADVGDGAVGILAVEDEFLLERSSALLGLEALETLAAAHSEPEINCPELPIPTRVLPAPVALEVALRKQELVVLAERAFVVESLRFEQRLEAVEWWKCAGSDRDYFRAWLSAVKCGHALPRRPSADRARGDGLEVLIYRDRQTGKAYLQALYD